MPTCPGRALAVGRHVVSRVPAARGWARSSPRPLRGTAGRRSGAALWGLSAQFPAPLGAYQVPQVI
ncbi:phage DNA packaging protein J [Streptomyces sp. NPDC102462]|uniref:phage DNA packaging protein J n=1 Tax=Streptomyces sp. NPDC102462 TaxID=3366178 RepID=UPI0038019069